MPELPEVETVRLQLKSKLIGKCIYKVKISDKNLRKPLLFLNEKKIIDLKRWGKRLFIILDGEEYLDISLGMTGKFKVQSQKTLALHDHVLFFLSGGVYLVYNDVRRFGWIELKKGKPDFKGWDPILDCHENLKSVVFAFKKSKKNLFNFLMSQDYIAGLGNIYVQEALFRAKLSPFRLCEKTSEKLFKKLITEIKKVLNEALFHKGSTIINYRSFNDEEGGFQNKLKVYGKDEKFNCETCFSPLVKVKLSRTITYCQHCQK